MAGLASTIKLGRPTKELSFDGAVYPIGETLAYGVAPKQAKFENYLGEMFRRVTRKYSKTNYKLNIVAASNEEVMALTGMAGISDTDLSFIFANAWTIPSERYVMETTTTFTLESTAMQKLDYAYNALSGAAQINVTGVWTVYDAKGAQVDPGTGTNYYASYARATRVVTCATPGAAGTVVYVNWNYTGVLCSIASMNVKKNSRHLYNNSNPAWDVDLTLEAS